MCLTITSSVNNLIELEIFSSRSYLESYVARVFIKLMQRIEKLAVSSVFEKAPSQLPLNSLLAHSNTYTGYTNRTRLRLQQEQQQPQLELSHRSYTN